MSEEYIFKFVILKKKLHKVHFIFLKNKKMYETKIKMKNVKIDFKSVKFF